MLTNNVETGLLFRAAAPIKAAPAAAALAATGATVALASTAHEAKMRLLRAIITAPATLRPR